MKKEIDLNNTMISSKCIRHDGKPLNEVLNEKWIDVPFEKIGRFGRASVKTNGKVVDIYLTEMSFANSDSQLLKITDEKYFPKTFVSNAIFTGQELAVLYMRENDGTVSVRDISYKYVSVFSAHLSYNLIN